MGLDLYDYGARMYDPAPAMDVFTRNEYKNILIENLSYWQKYKGLEIFAWAL